MAADPCRGKASGTLALAIVAAELGVMFFGATLPTPLYPLYREAFGFGGVTLTLIYAVYVLGNLAALFIFGRLSDQLGRRRATLPAIAIGIVSALVFGFAQNVAWLFAARGLSGFATGLASGAATAWISELQPRAGQGKGQGKGAVTASAANFTGLAVGPLVAGALARFAPWPMKLSYFAYISMLVVIGGAIWGAPETVARPVGRWRDLSLRPRLGVPSDILLRFVSPAVTAFVTFALIGFYAALIPSLLAESLHEKSPLVAGGIVFELFTVAALTTVLAGELRSRTAMLSSLALFPPCVALLVWAELSRSMTLLLAAAAAAGVAGSLGYRGSLEVVNSIAPAEHRGEVVSSYLLAVFAGNSLPVIGIGLLSATANAATAHIAFAVVITLLAIAGLIVGGKYAPGAEGLSPPRR